MEQASILVIDDEQVICHGCSLALADEEKLVECCLSGAAGLKAATDGTYDVILLDMKLPDSDGMAILEAIRKEKPDAYIIVMTGYSTVQNAVQAMKLGAFDYLSKPFTDDELTIAVDRALDKKRLVEENILLRQRLLIHHGFDNIVGENQKFLRALERIEKVASTDSTVLIYGESGTGKELVARALHTHSARKARQFVAVDCSALSTNLMESELFGHIRGAFTGAAQDRAGIFEVANGGTLFLDEVANLSMDIQAKLLRVLETQEYKPVGASLARKTDIRVVAATNRDLKSMVGKGEFREDLFYRLNVFPAYLPPLRERKDDIPKLAYHFLRVFCKKTGKRIEGFTDDALETLVGHEWPGNVRQLKNVIERLVIMSDSDTVDLMYLLEHMQVKNSLEEGSIPDTFKELKTIKKRLFKNSYEQLQKAFLIKALKACDGNVTRAAERVGMKRPNFHTLMKKYGLSSKGPWG